MTDSTLEFAEERGLGKVLGRVRLDSGIPLSDGSRMRATLLLSESGLWLVAARDRFHGAHVDLLTHGDLRLLDGRLRDRLCFGQEALTIPAGRRNAVERLIALGRLASAARGAKVAFKPSRLLHAPDELAQAWLARDLEPGEILICWLPGSNRLTLGSLVTGDSSCQPYLFVTERRAAIVLHSPVGDLSYTPLHADAVSLRADGDKVALTCGDSVFVSRRSDARACRAAFELLALTQPKARLLEAARRLWLDRERKREEAEQSLALCDAAIALGSQRARFARLLGLAELHEGDATVDCNAVLLALSPGRLSPPALGDLWTSFRFSERAADALVHGLLDAGEAGLPFALAVQRRAHTTPTVDERTARHELRIACFSVATRLLGAAPDARDLAVRAVLGERGLLPHPEPPEAAQSPLSNEAIEGPLTHPLARGQGSLVAGAQKLIALSPEPDHAALSDYCEALDGQEHPAARRALDTARLAFSLPDLHAYVSRGKKSLGLRGYEGKSHYILLGQAHLDPQSTFYMSEAELYFAIGAEALHLKLGQARLTSNEVWAGAFARTKSGVELVLALLPLAKGLPLALSAAKFLEKIPEPALRRGLEALVRLEKSQRPVDPSAPLSALSHSNENLVAAHRLMQMSADRAGLLLSGDLRASLRALLLVRPETRALLDAMCERDLVSVLLEGEKDSALHADLTVRFAALLDFYVGEDYLALSRALRGSAGPGASIALPAP